MSNYDINTQELEGFDDEPQVAFGITREGEEVSRLEARVFSENDMIAASDAVANLSSYPQEYTDQIIASIIEPIRMKWLNARDSRSQGIPAEPNPSAQAVEPQAVEATPRYEAILPGTDDNGQAREVGIRSLQTNRLLSNFVLSFDEEIAIQDDTEPSTEFGGLLTLADRSVPFRIKSAEYADNGKLKEALYANGGCGLLIHCRMEELRNAIGSLSGSTRRRRTLTTNFGWTKDRTAYMTPSVRISQNGVELVDDQTELRVDLGGQAPASLLDMKRLSAEELTRVKRHIVTDLLTLNTRMVTHTLLGTAAAAVLYPFTKSTGRFSLWVTGQTGAGKSFVAKLFMNFFGNYSITNASVSTWSATPNFVQRAGYDFKDAMYLVEDYKPELFPNTSQLLRVLQTYADNTARGRLNADSTAKALRPIRGLMVCTGEDTPEHNASAIARSIIVKVPNRAKNLEAGKRCVQEYENYSGVMADFIRWLIVENKLAVFTERSKVLEERYYTDVAGQQNDIRIAANLGQLGASFELFAEYLGDVWAEWGEVARTYVEVDLIELRNSMLGEAKEQQASEIFLSNLAELVRYEHVRIEGIPRDTENKPLIGRQVDAVVQIPGPDSQLLEISMPMALAQVNASLRQQGRPELRATERALLTQLREDGKLRDRNGEIISADGEPTQRVRLDGQQLRVFAISRRDLLGT